MTKSIVGTTYVPLRPPYQIIKYNKDVAIQIGTLIVTVQILDDERAKYNIETHSHPVVTYEYKDRIDYSNRQLVEHEFLEGAVWNKVEVRDVTTVCLTGSTLSWTDFIRVLMHESWKKEFKYTPNLGLYWHLKRMGVKVLPPEGEERTLSLNIDCSATHAGYALRSDLNAPLFLDVWATEGDVEGGKSMSFSEDGDDIYVFNPDTGKENVIHWRNNEQIFNDVVTQLVDYRNVLRDLLSDNNVKQYIIRYTSEEKRFKELVNALNEKCSDLFKVMPETPTYILPVTFAKH